MVAFGNSTAMNSGLGRIEDKCCFERTTVQENSHHATRIGPQLTMNATESILLTELVYNVRLSIADVAKWAVDAKEWHNASAK